MSITFNESDLTRIQGKLKKLQDNCAVRPGTEVYNLTLKYVTDYQRAVVNAMGVVSGSSGGSVSINLPGIGSQCVNWEPLAESTLAYKMAQGLYLTVWKATGSTQDSVALEKNISSANGAAEFMAGIDRQRHPNEYAKAINMEYGGVLGNTPVASSSPVSWPSRPLFTIANQIFMDHKAEIVNAVQLAILRGVNWGS